MEDWKVESTVEFYKELCIEATVHRKRLIKQMGRRDAEEKKEHNRTEDNNR